MVTFRKLAKADKKSLREINRLLPQLSSAAKRLSSGDLKKILSDKNNVFLLLRNEEKVVGMGVAVFVRTPRGLRVRAEDVIIDRPYRRKGLGSLLVRRLVYEAKKRKALWIEFTSRKDRVETAIFYKKLGFKPRDTNVYRLSFSK